VVAAMSFNPYQPPTSAYDSGYTAADAGPIVTDRIVQGMRKTKPWVTFLAVLGFIGAGFSALGGLGMLLGGASSEIPGGAGIGLAYLVIAGLYFAPALFLFRYGSSIGKMLAGGGLPELENAVESQASFWQLTGVLVIVGFVLGIVMTVAMAAVFASQF
jgi:hypothetical protein